MATMDDFDRRLAELQQQKQRAKDDPRIGELVAAATAGDVETVRQLLASGADPNAPAPVGSVMQTPVWAAIRAHQAAVIPLLAGAGADLNAGRPLTPLVAAVNSNQADLVAALIAAGADVDRPDNAHQTPLLKAVLNQSVEMVETLIRAGADPNLIPLKQAHETVSNYSPLQLAGLQGDRRLLNVLSNAGGTAAEDLDATLLCSAAGQGDRNQVAKLLDDGVDVNAARDAQHQTPLICAAIHGKTAIVKYLLQRGADPNLPGGAKRDGESPLIAAALSGRVEVVQALMEAGADPDYTPADHPHGTALTYAKEERLKNVVEYLVNAQAARRGGTPDSSKVPTPRRSGVPTFETNDAAVLLRADVEAVSAAFATRVDCARRRKGMLGKKVKLTGRCYAVFSIVGQPWTAIMKLHAAYSDWPSVADAAALSESLQTQAMYVANSDTGGVAHYALFDRGKLVELFDSGTAGESDTVATISHRFATLYQLDLTGLPNVQVNGRTSFASAARHVDLMTVSNGLNFIDDFVRQQGAFVPFFADEWGLPGERVELSLEGFGPDDIERLDFISAAE
jgi:ankyrin repeat protein